MEDSKSALEILWDILTPRQRKTMMLACGGLAQTFNAAAKAAEEADECAQRLLNVLNEEAENNGR